MSALSHKILAVDDTPDLLDAYRKVFQTAQVDTELHAMANAFADEPTTEAADTPSAEAEATLQLDCFSQGLDAVAGVEKAFLQNEPYAVAFVDMRMPPGIDGLETMRRMWMIDPDLQIVICTAHHDHELSEIRAQARALNGSFLIIRKPFDPEEVLQSAYTCAERANQQRNEKAIYTIVPGPNLQIKRVAPRLSTASALVFNDWIELPDGNRRKVFKLGLDDIPDTPKKALQHYITQAPRGIAEMRLQVAAEEERLHQARLMLEAFENGTLSTADFKMP